MVNTLEKVSNVHLEDVFAVLFVLSNPFFYVPFPVVCAPPRNAPAGKLIHPFHECVITGCDNEMMNYLLIVIAWFFNHSHFLARSLIDANFPVS